MPETLEKTWIFKTENISKILLAILLLATSTSVLIIALFFQRIEKNNPFNDYTVSETTHTMSQLGRETLRLQVLLASLSSQTKSSEIEKQFDLLESRVRIVRTQAATYKFAPSSQIELSQYEANWMLLQSYKESIIDRTITQQDLAAMISLLSEMERIVNLVFFENQSYTNQQQRNAVVVKKRLLITLAITYLLFLLLLMFFFLFVAQSAKEREKTLAVLNSSEERYQKIVENAEEGIWILDSHHNIVFFNSKLLSKLRISGDDLLNNNALDLCASEYFAMLLKQQLLELDRLKSASIDICLQDREGNPLWFYVNNTFVDFYGEGDRHVLSLLTDITERKQIEEELKAMNERLTHQANFDELTQIANRRYFNLYAIKTWQQALSRQNPLSLVIIDIDYFKKYNDFYGHLQGDVCLFQVAQVISSAAQREHDLAARYGGEEFVLLFPNTTQAEAIKIIEELQSDLANLQLEHKKSIVQEFVTLSIGLVTGIPSEKNSLEQALNLADEALYDSKNKGRNQYSTLRF